MLSTIFQRTLQGERERNETRKERENESPPDELERIAKEVGKREHFFFLDCITVNFLLPGKKNLCTYTQLVCGGRSLS